MITGKCLNRTIGHIALLHYFPAASQDALAALGEVLGELCADDAQLEKVITATSRPGAEWTGVGDLRETIASVLRPAWKPKCAKCGDNGFKFEGASYAPCDCPPGRARARDETAENERRLAVAEAESARRAILRESAESDANPDPSGRAVEEKQEIMSQCPL